MPTELKYLAASIILGIAQILTATMAVTKQRGVKWNVGARDQQLPPPHGMAGRLTRAAENFKETFPFFIAAVTIAQLSNKSSATTALGAQIYFYGRLLYIPIYAAGISHIRTLVWSVATCGIAIVLFGTF